MRQIAEFIWYLTGDLIQIIGCLDVLILVVWGSAYLFWSSFYTIKGEGWRNK
jgi:hypothetical protein